MDTRALASSAAGSCGGVGAAACGGAKPSVVGGLPSAEARRMAADALILSFPNAKFFQLSFHDLFGVQRSKLVPRSALRSVASAGAGFAGFAAHLDISPVDGDLLAIPDASTATRLPWKPEVVWVACDLELFGVPLAHGPRNVARGALERLKAVHGVSLKTGVEAEFFVLQAPENAASSPLIGDSVLDAQAKPCYDAHALMRKYDFISKMLEYMEALGWKPYQADHEDANGQFEINWEFDDALVSADRHAFFKYMARSVAEAHGFRVTFMPKPFIDKAGSGCHAHISLHDVSTGANVCGDASNSAMHGLSSVALSALSSILEGAPALAALTNPTVNSYKRINCAGTTSGATWSPDAIAWAGNNRTAMVRVPDAPRMELRLADMAVNPYLLSAGIAALVHDGLDRGLAAACPPPSDVNFYDHGSEASAAARARAGRLPRSLRDALDALDDSAAMRRNLGDAFVDSYLKLRRAHWDEYTAELSAWEVQQYLDC
mmetsp:Transcript_90858/g.231203  ORF Transcript_90858/g.231203 Transcript_90858/m.231203 type:complete len:491 (-) Transcript_90858:157-1629(-)